MTDEQIQQALERGLTPIGKAEIKFHRTEHSDMLDVLVVCENFKEIGWFTRICTICELLSEREDEFSKQYSICVEAVTSAELATRSIPWPL